jgi:hypothetical protein
MKRTGPHGSTHRVRSPLEFLGALSSPVPVPYDLILCDVMMPNLSGAGVHQRLSSLRPAVVPRIVFVPGGMFTAEDVELMARLPIACRRSRSIETSPPRSSRRSSRWRVTAVDRLAQHTGGERRDSAGRHQELTMPAPTAMASNERAT